MKLDTFRCSSFCSGDDYKSQKLFVVDAVLINAAFVITSGYILSGYLLHLGATDFLSALINSSASFSAIFCIFSFMIFERIANRKRLLLIMNFVSRTFMLMILALPYIFKTDATLFLFLAVLVMLADIIFSLYRVGWLVWLMDIAPVRNRTNYIYMRMFYLRCAFAIVTFISGYVLDFFDKGYTGFAVLFGVSYLFSVADIFVLKKIREKSFVLDLEKKNYSKFMIPLKVRRYREYLIFIFLFYFSFSVASAYTPVYMIKYLQFDYKFILSMNVLTMLAMIFSNLLWMRIENLRGSRFVLIISSLMQALALIIIGSTTKQTFFFLYFSSVISGIGAGGFNTTSFSYRYTMMPEIGKTIYESWFYLVFGIATLIAPFTGKMLINILPEIENAVFENSRIQLLFFISFVLICLSVLYVHFGTGKKTEEEQIHAVDLTDSR